MQDNIFLGGGDPLLGGRDAYGRGRDIDAEIGRLRDMRRQLDGKRDEIDSARVGKTAPGGSPIWDEIDRTVDDMTDRELAFLDGNEEFRRSNAAVTAILQREHLRMMRPVVEACEDGGEALRKHLELVRRLRKEAANESDKTLGLFKEYTEKYADMPYSEFLKMRRNQDG